MKKVILFFLLLAGTANSLSAQNITYYHQPGLSEQEILFNSPKPGKAKANFHFFGLGKKYINFTLELYTIKQLYQLPNLDSVIMLASEKLKVIADSLKDDGIVRRVDMLNVGSKTPRIRIINYNTLPQTYVIKDGELNTLKIGRDTLRIQIAVATGQKTYSYNEEGRSASKTRDEYRPVFLTFTLNNFNDIASITDGVLSKCLERLSQDVSRDYVTQNPAKANYTAFYNWQTNKMFSPSKTKWIKWGQYRDELVPNIYGSLQLARGIFSPSMAAGLRYTNYRDVNLKKHFYLMWEPYFFFTRDGANKLLTERNDFITFRYTEYETKNEPFDYTANFSFGYLVGRKGDWFEKNTFKLGLPGVRSGWLQLEPEFYFNNFLKNFSPTIKLTIHYE